MAKFILYRIRLKEITLIVLLSILNSNIEEIQIFN